MAVLLANNAFGTLTTGIDGTVTSISLDSGQGARFPLPTDDDVFYVTLVNQANELEIVMCTERVGDTLTIVRAQEGTVARSYVAGDRVELRLTAGVLDSINNLVPLSTVVAIGQGLTGSHPIPLSGVVDSSGFMLCDGATIPGGNKVSGATPNLTDGRFLRGSTSSGATGGSDTFTLAVGNLPSHNHNADTASAGSHTHTGSTGSAGNHSHNYTRKVASSPGTATLSGNRNNVWVGTRSVATSNTGAHTHSVSISNTGAHTHTVSVGSTGSGTAVTHIPRYFDVVYIMRVN